MATPNEPRQLANKPTRASRPRRGKSATSGALVQVAGEEPIATLVDDDLIEGTEGKAITSGVPRALISADQKFMDAEQTKQWIALWNLLSRKYRALQIRLEEYLSRWNKFRADKNFKTVYEE